ncbi:MAG: hypothetical protein AMXMBFR8_02240 [Nevskiales bacterium]
MPRIDTKSGRDRLAVRREPYWLKLETGRSLGYRKTAAAGFWIARYRDRAGKKHYNALGQSTGDDFDNAKRRAEAWFKTITGGGGVTVRTGSVEAAVESYARGLEKKGRKGTAADARARFAQFVNSKRIVGRKEKREIDGDPLGNIAMDRLTRDDMEAWLDRVNNGKRSASSVNRNLRQLKAALAYAVKVGYAANPIAWESVDALPNADRARGDFLDADQRRALLDNSPDNLRRFLTALLYCGARPGELARAVVADFDAKQKTLTLRSAKGRGGKIRTRSVPLTAAAVALFAEAAKGKLPKAPLLTGPDGGAWTKMQLSRATRAAVKAAKLPKAIVPYSMRHAAISEWLAAGINPVTCAKMAGTSVLMIEKHYHKFIAEPALEKLEAVKLL